MLCPLINKYTTPAEREAGCYFAEGFESAESVIRNGWTIANEPVINNGLSLSGTTEYVTQSGFTFEVKDAITLIYEFVPGNGFIFGNSTAKRFSTSSTGNGFHYFREDASNNIQFAIGNAVVFDFSSATLIPYLRYNKKNIIAVTVNLSNGDERKLFFNGVKLYDVNAGSLTNIWTPMENFTLGGNVGGGDRFDGKFISFKAFDRVLSDQELYAYHKGNSLEHKNTSIKPIWSERFINETLLESHFNKDIHYQNNCCTSRIEQELDTTSGWSAGGGGSIASVDSTDTAAHLGDYCLKATASGTSNRTEIVFDTTSGRKYRISFWAKRGSQGTNQQITGWVNLTGAPVAVSIPSTDWTYFEYDVTASSTTATVRIYETGPGVGSSGDIVYVDCFSILEMPDIQGSPTIDNGAEFDGTSDYIIFPTLVPAITNFSAVLEFNPDFAGNDGNAHYLFDSDSRYFVFKNASDELVIQLANTEIAAITNATWNGYWSTNHRNVLIVSADSERTDVWLNNNLILDTDTTAWTPALIGSITFGGEDESSTDAFDGEITCFKIFDKCLETVDATAFQASIHHKPTNLVAHYPFTSSTCDLSNVIDTELLADNDMETVGVADWTAINSATLTKETTSPYEGSQVLKVAYSSVSTPRAQQSILTIGAKYQITGWARSNGVNPPRVYDGGTTLWTGTTSTSWQEFNLIVTVASTGIGFGFAGGSSSASYCEFDGISIKNILVRVLDISGNENHAASTLATSFPDKILDRHGYTCGANFLETTIVPPKRGAIIGIVKYDSVTGSDLMIIGSLSPRAYLGVYSGLIGGAVGNDTWSLIHGTAGNIVEVGKVHVLMLSWNGTTATLFLDGREAYSAAHTGYPGTYPFYLAGANSNGTDAFHWVGDIYEIQILSQPLTQIMASDIYLNMMKRLNRT